MLAGEPSGDHHAAAFVRALRDRRPGVRFAGTGGPRMKAEGVALMAELDRLAVMGFVEVLPRIPWFRKLEARVLDWIDRERPALVVLVDYPGFNLRIAKAAHRRGCRVLYYIAPQVWAWKKGRAKTLAEVTDGIATILPFEADLLRSYGAPAEYVGHPLLDREPDGVDRATFCTGLGLDADRPILGVLPGSREQELDQHLDAFGEIARAVVEVRPDVQPVISRADSVDTGRFGGLDVPVTTDTRSLQRWSDAALVKSGTSTLETTLERTPFVIAYRTSPVTSAIADHVLHIEHIGLPNLVAGRRIVPEFRQGDVSAAVVAPVLLELLDPDSARRRAQLEAFEGVIEQLGTPGAAGRVADMACAIMERPA